MEIKKRRVLVEASIYLLVGVSAFFIISLPALITQNPSFSLPQQSTLTSTSSTSTPPVPPPVGPDVSGIGSVFILLGQILLAVILIAGLVGTVIAISSFFRDNKTLRQSERTKLTPEEKIEKLRFSRELAAKILRNAVETGNYSTGIVDAYHSLDQALNAFRGASRPKHWTPKEYATFVSGPLFRPAVYQIVDIFYSVRYGLHSGTEEQVQNFLKYLHKLFEKEVGKNELPEERAEFDKVFNKINLYKIPIKGDLTSPTGLLQKEGFN